MHHGTCTGLVLYRASMAVHGKGVREGETKPLFRTAGTRGGRVPFGCELCISLMLASTRTT